MKGERAQKNNLEKITSQKKHVAIYIGVFKKQFVNNGHN